jgi:putative transposase
MQSRITKELVLDALLMAVWHKKPKTKVLVHSDQGGQYNSKDEARQDDFDFIEILSKAEYRHNSNHLLSSIGIKNQSIKTAF